MRLFYNYLVVAIAFLIQVAVMPYFRVFGIIPDIVLVTVVCFSFIEGQLAGGLNGFFGGVLQDLISLRGFGVNALSYTIVGYGSGLFEQTLFAGNLFLVVPAVAIATIASHFLYVWLAFLVGYQIHLSFFGTTIPTAIYNGLLSVVVFIPLSKFWGRFVDEAPKGVIS
ncbi:MAG: rod shape-determining protein MreD [Actinobacteria bacterium]|nr:MAG: rod shape-determining protein MreD [Actinomycetota bacterium]